MSAPKKVVVFGDSIAFGAWDSEGGWVDRLRKYHHHRYLSTQNRDKYRLIYNLGVPGDTSADIVKRYDLELDSRTQRDPMKTLVCIAVGMNDLKPTDDTNEYAIPIDLYLQNIISVISKSKNRGVNVALIGIPQVSENLTARKNRDVVEYESALKWIAQQHDLPFVEISKHFDSRADLLSEDGVHPNKAGHALIFEQVLESRITR